MTLSTLHNKHCYVQLYIQNTTRLAGRNHDKQKKKKKKENENHSKILSWLYTCTWTKTFTLAHTLNRLMCNTDLFPHSGISNILSINEKLPMTRVHLTQEHFWFFLNRELPSLRLSFLWCTVPCIGTTENGIRHEWNHDTLSLTSTSCFHLFLWETAKLWCFLKLEPHFLYLME